MSLETMCVKTEAEEADMCDDEAGACVKEEVECEDSAALCELYAGHQVKDELALGPEELHRPCVLSALPGVELKNTMSLKTLCVKTEEAEVCEEEAGTDVKEEVEFEDSAALCELYADHQVKDELALGPEELHRPCVLSALQQIKGQALLAYNEPPKKYKRQARVQEKKESTEKRSAVENLNEPSTSLQVESAMNTDIQEAPPEEPVVNTFIADTDSNETNFNCDMCSKGFDIKSELETQELMKNGESLKTSNDFTCKKCTCTFETKLLLVEHAKSRHAEEYFTCSECEYMTCYKGSLQIHLRIHTGERPFKCSQCNSAFAQSSHLKSHLRLHTGMKPFKCAQCGSAFAQSCHLRRHLRTHTGEKPFKCTQCSSAFAHKITLQKHLRIHTGEKPFECNICEYKTTRSSDLKTHLMSRHSGQKPYGCDSCSYRGATRQNLSRHIKIHHKQV